MDLTQAQLLAALGARSVTGARFGVCRAVEDRRHGVRISGEVLRNRDGTFITVNLCHGKAAGPVWPFCIFQADGAAGRFAAVTFMLGGVNYLRGGAWSVFTAADACAFVRAVMRELEAGRLPDLDALLTVAGKSDPPRVIDWRGR